MHKSKNNKILFILFFGILFLQNIFAQKNYVEGHIVTFENDTLSGFIDYQNWKKNPTLILFKNSKMSAPVIYSPKEINGFEVGDEIYISASVKIETSPIKLKELTDHKEFSFTSDKVFLQTLINKYPENKMLAKALSSLQNGSPITARLVIEQLSRGTLLNLAECFQMELSMAFQCSVTGEFQEGVRARLIDKDNQPNWLYKEDSDIPDHLIQAHFSRFNREHSVNGNEPVLENPLQYLVAEYGE